MLNSKVVREAHKMTREIKTEYPAVDYRLQYGLCLSYLLNKEDNVMIELKGTEKQVKWANDIRNQILEIKANYEIAKANLKVLTKEEEGQPQPWRKVVTQSELNDIENRFKKYLTTDSAKMLIDRFAYSKLSKNIAKMIEKNEYKDVIDSLYEF